MCPLTGAEVLRQGSSVSVDSVTQSCFQGLRFLCLSASILSVWLGPWGSSLRHKMAAICQYSHPDTALSSRRKKCCIFFFFFFSLQEQKSLTSNPLGILLNLTGTDYIIWSSSRNHCRGMEPPLFWFFQVSPETYGPFLSKAGLWRQGEGAEGQLQSLWDHHTTLSGHPLVFIMYLLCYIFHSFPFLHKKYINIFLL